MQRSLHALPTPCQGRFHCLPPTTVADEVGVGVTYSASGAS